MVHFYALKVTNPYYSLKEWRDEKAYGQTEYDRWQEMLSLSDSIQDLSVEDQNLWLDRFAEMLENEESRRDAKIGCRCCRATR